MSTRNPLPGSGPQRRLRPGPGQVSHRVGPVGHRSSPVGHRSSPIGDPDELIALVVGSRQAVLLRVHSHRLRPDDLEECFSQAALELMLAVRRGARFAGPRHAAAALEQRFLSRIQDRRRAIEGRSVAQAELERALAAGALAERGGEIPDRGAELERLVMLRDLLALLPQHAKALTSEQRLALACQVALQMDCREFCERFGWTPEKYRKVVQRARARLRMLAED